MGPQKFSKPQTRKAEIVAVMRKEIDDGLYNDVPDRRLPSRDDMCQRFDVSEQVIKAVYGQLINDMYVISRPRDGYFVRTTDITVVHADTYERLRVQQERFAEGGGDAWEEDVRAQGREPFQIPDVRIINGAPPAVLERLGLTPKDPVFLRDRLRFVDGVPNHIATSYYPAWVADGTVLSQPGNLAERGGLMAAAGHPYVYTSPYHVARMPTYEESERMSLPEATAVQEIIVTRFDEDDRPVAVMVCVAPGDRAAWQYDKIVTGDASASGDLAC